MTSINRRLLIKLTTLGLGALALPGAAQALGARGFTHGVASGEPRADSVLLWTRYVGAEGATLRCEMAEDATFARIVAGGDAQSSAERDYCVKTTLIGLTPGRWFYYRFVAPDGTISPVGRTRTLPVGEVEQFGIGLFSCSNMPYGWFNAYAHAAERTDLDLMIHVGDYIYEYPVGTYPEARFALPGRDVQPSHEIISLADYRLRHAAYRLDPDLQRLHQQFPMIAQWDDHELANDAWMDGAQNHDPQTEGSWSVRRAAAERAYREWMPVSDAPYGSYQIGSLATIFRPETRVTGRMEQLDLAAALAGQADIDQALVQFRDGPWSAPERTLMGLQQEAWLEREMKTSAAQGVHWQILAQQVVMGALRMPDAARDWFGPALPESARKRVQASVAASRMGLPFNLDSWDGYPAARQRLLSAALEADANLVVLSGDSHNAWGNNLKTGGRAAGVEFAGHSVSSPGFETYIPGVPAADVATALRQTNPDLIFTDTSRRGYVSLTVTPEKVDGRWHFMQEIRQRSSALAGSHGLEVQKDRRQFT